MRLLRTFTRLSGPHFLLLAAVTYTLGAGIARYLGALLRERVLVLGLLVVLLLQASMGWLAAAFRPAYETLLEDETPLERMQIGRSMLFVALAGLAAAAALAFAMLRFEGATFGAALCLGMSIAVIIVYALPPIRGADRGFGELLLAVQIAYLVPTLGFLLQAADLHRLLTLCTLALACLFVATLIVLGLPSYAADVKREHATILTRMGWERALMVHHALIVTSYTLLGVSIALGFSFDLIGPAFLTVPFALLQAWLLRGIAGGARPIWNLLRANAIAIFALTAYFLALSFWLH